ncbi:hypothetical protein BDU57DRAFT_571947 [Ampelomyces quisqualis]|uniref:Uncharacterized protein n=1 Tax=Ampelomyces quisqualis TaxID=50730 RepID=A0A6A5QRK9_AMPQU|nr:hypothetical protein BDU57DRAFT_571947 [Ampelomyces quisqualis]
MATSHSISGLSSSLIFSQSVSALSIATASTQLIPMSNSEPQSRFLPSGIDPDVQHKINELFEESEALVRPSLSQRSSSSKKSEAWWTTDSSSPLGRTKSNLSQEDKNTNSNGISSEEGIFESDGKDFRLPPPESDDDPKELNPKGSRYCPEDPNTSSTPIAELLDPNPKIIARYYYPSEYRPATPPRSPTRQNPSPQPPPLMLASLLSTLCMFILSLFTPDAPAIIEYTPQEIAKKIARLQVEAQVVAFDVPEKLVGVVALLHIGGENSERHAIPITARPKRVRELLRQCGYTDMEDDFGEEIKRALKELGRGA